MADRRRRTRLGAVALAVTGSLLMAACGDETTGPAQDTEGATPDIVTAEVTRRDLVETKTLSGTLGYGAPEPLATNTTGIVTWLPEDGTVVGFGEPLLRVNDLPVLLMEGATPAWRPFESGMDDGTDITLLEQNLVDLGYAADLDVTIDDELTDVTLDAIEVMYDELLDDDADESDDIELRRVELGMVVFSPTPVRVASFNVSLGQSITPAVAVANITDQAQVVELDIDAADRDLVAEGTVVTVELPGGEQVAGEVTELDEVATRLVNPQTGEVADPTIGAEVTMTEAPEGAFDAAPVDVIVTETVTAGVLTVPAAALIALAEGGHAVEVVGADGATTLVAVEIGTFVDDIVEITGGVAEGDQVVLPAS